jgi:formylglycine-generating enzyme required for sulfatase activity
MRAIDSFFLKIRNTKCEALFFYSGHGIQYKGENFLVPVDANLFSPADLSIQCVRLDYIMNKLEDAKTRINIIILDACRNDPWSKSWTRGDDNEGGLATPVNTPPQSFIAYATAPSKKASDGGGTNSAFSTALAKYITNPGLTIFEVFQKVLAEVRRMNADQIPWNTYSLDANYYFIATKDLTPGRVPMEIVVSEDYILFIDGVNKGSYTGGGKVKLDYPAGTYKIRVINQHDSTMYSDTVYHYDPVNSTADNFMYIPLNNKVVNTPQLIRPLLDSIKYNMVRVGGGTFKMGSRNGNNDETPSHNVSSRTFYISKYEVTQRQWTAIMGSNPSFNKNCNDCPVENVSWEETNDFIRKLNSYTQGHYRLPTEAEWEFAAGGGILRSDYLFSGNRRPERVAWFYGNASGKSHPVGTKVANELGITDMSGNVAEWCSDWYDVSYYSRSELENPEGPAGPKSEKVVRGGSWDDYEQLCRIVSREKKSPNQKSKNIGFRIAL